MPPKKKYEFIHYSNSNISVIIEAYSYETAMEFLVFTTKHPADFLYQP